MSATERRSSGRPALAVVLNSLVEAVVLTDADGVVTYANTVAVERLGAGKYIGVPFAEQAARHEALAADEGPLARDQHPVSRALAGRAPILNARLIIRPAGLRPSTYRVNTVLIKDGDRIAGTSSVFHDIATALALETDLADHAARLEAIVNLVSDAVYLVDGEGRLIFRNEVGDRLLGLPPGASLSERVRRLALRDPDGDPIGAEDYPATRALSGETVSEETYQLQAARGTLRHVVVNAHPLRRPDGAIYAALVTMNDVTDEVHAREELEAARAAAEEASHLKDQFIAALSHELRTPLQPILGWTEVLRRHGSLDATTSQALEVIRRNIRQQVRLVDDLLDLSRIVHGKLALRFEIFDLNEQVRAAAEPYEEIAALKRVRLTLAMPEEPVPMWGDGARIQQIASNLISNAMKFTPPGGQIAVQLVVSETEALLEVEDTGEGIAPDELGVIFEAFRQGSAARRRGGLGIGLDLVKRLVELHGGTVDVSSEGHGYGSRFSVRLPRRLPRTPVAAETTPAGRRLEHHDIVLIEDNADTREVMKFILETEGAHVQTAESGEDGFALARRARPDIILCDIGLPDIDGLEVARRVRAEPDLDGVKLIALTGYGQPEDVRTALEAGFEAHLTKPINLDQLLALLAEA
ncbi:MAG: response regulator [Candidatus Rokubacteria bacterium]|nr:response regulator [Candidatus Rokubacteria bacterium]